MRHEVTQLAKDEGFREYPYEDSEGYLTVGHGFNIEPDAIHPVVKRLLGYTTYPLSEVFSKFILTEVVVGIWRQLSEEFPEQPTEVRRILLNMQYQLGYTGLRKFRKTLAAIRERDYQTASEEMLDSSWAKQTPNRALRLSERMAAV